MVTRPASIIRCPGCGAKNRISPQKTGFHPKCGKCGTPLNAEDLSAAPADTLLLRCEQCGTKNRLPRENLDDRAKCGKCGFFLSTDELFSAEPLMITDSNFKPKVLHSSLPVLLFAWAPWCPTCRTFMPVIDDFAAVAKGKVRVGKLNVDNNPMLSSKFNILSVPFVFIFDNGRLKESFPGAMQKHEVMMKMAHYL